MTESGPTLLVDGNNLLMRSVRAMQDSGLSADGVATGPLVSFINSLAKYVRECRPTHLVVCWDSGGSTYRTSIYPDYKANRKVQPDDVVEFESSAFGLAKRFLALANIYQVQFHGVEADDIIAAHWRQRGVRPAIVVSGDKDLLQLVEPGWTQIRPGNPDEVWDEERVQAEFGCTPEQWADVLTLMGDSVDGVPGVPRVGMKTAVKDLGQHDWDMAKLIATGPDRYAANDDLIERNRRLVNLRDGQITPYIPISMPPEFRPTDSTSITWTDLLGMLDGLRLASIGSRMRIGNFWG